MPYSERDRRLEYSKSWYQLHRSELIEKRRKQQLKINQWYHEYKSTLLCIECGESHPACLHFHHRDRRDKLFNIADFARRPTSKKRLLEEINKCDVLCVNCHAKKHWKEWYHADSWEEILCED